MLSESDYREQFEKANQEFGARLQIREYGTDGLTHQLESLLGKESSLPGYSALSAWEDKFSKQEYDLLKAELISKHLAAEILSLRNYGLGYSRTWNDTVAMNRIEMAVPQLTASLDSTIKRFSNSGSPSLLNLKFNWILFQASLNGREVKDMILERAPEDDRNDLIFVNFYRGLSRAEDMSFYLESYRPYFQGTKWQPKWEDLADRFEIGADLKPASFLTLEGEDVTIQSYLGKPTVLYFYFSTCTHSENYFKNYLMPIYRETAKNTGHQILAISVDNDPALWKNSIATYSDHSLINLNLPSEQWKDWLEYYLIDGYPRTMLLDKAGQVQSLRLQGEEYEDLKSRFLRLIEASDESLNPNQ
jgi:thiol-disulfide isomerase/thioredoxin